MKIRLTTIMFFAISFTLFAQPEKISIDLNNDGKGDQVLFYDIKTEFEKETIFNRFDIIYGIDTVKFYADDYWILNHDLYDQADINIKDRVGVFKGKDKVYFWLSGPPYGCCLNETTIYQVYPDTMKIIYNEFEVKEIEVINGKKYFGGLKSLSENYSCSALNLNFRSFNPVYFYNISDGFIQDDPITIMKNSIYKTIEPKVNIFHATILYDFNTKEEILINQYFEKKICERKYAVVSLFKLNEGYLIYFSGDELKKMRNEVFASYGYKFQTKDLIGYFKYKEWYEAKDISIEEINNKLTDTEKYNIALIKKMEER